MVWLSGPGFALVSLVLVAIPQVGAVDVTVSLNYSTYVGTAQSGTGVTEWLGIRYAAPPTGDLRFQRPQEPLANSAVQLANQHGPHCLATNGLLNDTTTSEDCLFLDVYAPSNATAGSKLPVYLFIQGGGFNTNSNADYNGTGLVRASGHNIVVVTFNYRVGPYGFLTDGAGVLPPNNGLFDQRKAMEWVQRHAARFGGDPGHVVLGGASAGAASVSLHLVAYGGRDDGLFHAAAAESVSFATVYTAAESRWQFANLAVRLGCAGNDAAVAACLRAATAAEIQAVNYNVPFPGAAAPPLYMYNPVVDGDLLPALTYTAFARGDFIKVPLLAGDDTNGGTVFAPANTTTLAQSNMFIRNQFAFVTPEDFGTVNALYPNANASACPAEGCYWRQVSDVYGEMRYMCPGLYLSSALVRYAGGAAAAGGPGSYAYRWDVLDPAQAAQGKGVPHTVELNAIWGPENTGGVSPDSYYPGGVNAGAVPVAQAYWTSFIRTFNPNTYRAPGSAEWATWNETAQARLLVSTGGNTSMEALAGSDLMQRCDFWYSIGEDIRQ